MDEVDKQLEELQAWRSNVNSHFESAKSKYETNKSVIKKLEKALATIKGLEGEIVSLQQRKVALLQAPPPANLAGNTISATRQMEGMKLQEGLGGEEEAERDREEAAARDREARQAVMSTIGEYLSRK